LEVASAVGGGHCGRASCYSTGEIRYADKNSFILAGFREPTLSYLLIHGCASQKCSKYGAITVTIAWKSHRVTPVFVTRKQYQADGPGTVLPII
jgi:hypothetical protein